jgi:hypothetical protein
MIACGDYVYWVGGRGIAVAVVRGVGSLYVTLEGPFLTDSGRRRFLRSEWDDYFDETWQDAWMRLPSDVRGLPAFQPGRVARAVARSRQFLKDRALR